MFVSTYNGYKDGRSLELDLIYFTTIEGLPYIRITLILLYIFKCKVTIKRSSMTNVSYIWFNMKINRSALEISADRTRLFFGDTPNPQHSDSCSYFGVSSPDRDVRSWWRSGRRGSSNPKAPTPPREVLDVLRLLVHSVLDGRNKGSRRFHELTPVDGFVINLGQICTPGDFVSEKTFKRFILLVQT